MEHNALPIELSPLETAQQEMRYLIDFYEHLRNFSDDRPVSSPKFLWQMTKEELAAPPKNHWASIGDSYDRGINGAKSALATKLSGLLHHVSGHRPFDMAQSKAALRHVADNLQTVRTAVDVLLQAPTLSPIPTVKMFMVYPMEQTRLQSAALLTCQTTQRTATAQTYSDYLNGKHTKEGRSFHGAMLHLHNSRTAHQMVAHCIYEQQGDTRGYIQRIVDIAGYGNPEIVGAFASEVLLPLCVAPKIPKTYYYRSKSLTIDPRLLQEEEED
jgi:hypothetical protein